VSHPRAHLDELIHQPIRFSIVAALASADELEFRYVRELVSISDSTLSRAGSQLEQVGYIQIRKGHVGKRPRTWLSLTEQGRAAFHRHCDALRDIVGESVRSEHEAVESADARTNPEGRPTPRRPHPNGPTLAGSKQ